MKHWWTSVIKINKGLANCNAHFLFPLRKYKHSSPKTKFYSAFKRTGFLTNRYQQHLPCVVETAIIYYVFSHSSMFFLSIFWPFAFFGETMAESEPLQQQSVKRRQKSLIFSSFLHIHNIQSLNFPHMLTRVIYWLRLHIIARSITFRRT